MNQDIRAFFQRLQMQPVVIAGHVASVEIDPATGQQRYARIVVGAQTLRVKVDAFAPPLANGDAVRLEQFGLAASAEYRLAGLEAGARPNSGLFAVLNDGTMLGGGSYAGGDYIFGKLDEGNLFIENQTGRLYHRMGLEVYGIEYPDGSQLYGHAIKSGGAWIPDGPNVYITPGGVYVRNGLTDAIRLLSDGSAYFKGDFYANSLEIGDVNGARLVGGVVVDFDTNGQPIITSTRYGLRLYDASGLPQIALLTGTVDNPTMPALLVGADNATSYLRWLDGILRLKGYAFIDGGQLGGFLVTAQRITSANNRVIVVNQNDGDFTEGLLLVCDVPGNAGTIAWRKGTLDSQAALYDGILTTYRDTDNRTKMLIGVSASLSGQVAANIRLECSTPASGTTYEKSYLELKQDLDYAGQRVSTLQTNAALTVDNDYGIRANLVQPLTDADELRLLGVTGSTWIGPGEFVYSTAAGTPGRLAADGSGLQCSSTGIPMFFKLDVPARFSISRVNLRQLTIYYRTTLAAAAISKIEIIRPQMIAPGGVEVAFNYATQLGGVTTVYDNVALLTETVYLMGLQHLIKVTLANVSDYGHVVIYGFQAEWGA